MVDSRFGNVSPSIQDTIERLFAGSSPNPQDSDGPTSSPYIQQRIMCTSNLSLESDADDDAQNEPDSLIRGVC